ncbi:MAG TPA: MFS transporter [Rubrobacteraceae bacterium]
MDRTRGGDVERQGSPIGRVAMASLIGTTMEWYDFFLYGTAAALIFNRLFFPSFELLAGTLASFAPFAVGFFARPVGEIFFGHLGDRIGRRSILVPPEERRRATGEPAG